MSSCRVLQIHNSFHLRNASRCRRLKRTSGIGVVTGSCLLFRSAFDTDRPFPRMGPPSSTYAAWLGKER